MARRRGWASRYGTWRNACARRSPSLRLLVAATLVACSAYLVGCTRNPTAGALNAVGVESEYASVVSQVAGPYATVRAIMTNPNSNPHEFEVSPVIARVIASADLLVENGLGYDAWVDKIVVAAPLARRRVINAQHLLGLPDKTVNPHLWYDPRTMPAIAAAAADSLSALEPAHAAYFQSHARQFVASLAPWKTALAEFRKRYGGTPVAVSEPVANDLLTAAGCVILTPTRLQVAIMNGTDPAPQDVAAQERLLEQRRVKVLVYNRQVTNPLTESFLALAKKNGIPVIGVYETMPTPGFDYQSWMMAETAALQRAVEHGVSTQRLMKRATRP